jgi:uncharacterized protein YeaC (DUF1315 family)
MITFNERQQLKDFCLQCVMAVKTEDYVNAQIQTKYDDSKFPHILWKKR